jgi:hypothetical protein
VRGTVKSGGSAREEPLRVAIAMGDASNCAVKISAIAYWPGFKSAMKGAMTPA